MHITAWRYVNSPGAGADRSRAGEFVALELPHLVGLAVRAAGAGVSCVSRAVRPSRALAREHGSRHAPEHPGKHDEEDEVEHRAPLRGAHEIGD